MQQLKFIDYFREKKKIAIERLKTFEDKALEEDTRGYLDTFSGGKDSITNYGLLKESGVKHYCQYSVTGLDFPELIYNMKNNYKDVEFVYPKMKDGTTATMWKLIEKKHTPPTRIRRYCCDVLKETLGKNKFIITGVRWAESSKRANRGALENFHKNKKFQFKSEDNDEARRLFENCLKKGKFTLNPIIDWTDDDIWGYIKLEGLKYPKLYDQGYKRLGCIGCPLSSNCKKELNDYPKIKKLYLRSFEKMIKYSIEQDKKIKWSSAEEVMRWYVGDIKQQKKVNINQISMKL